MGKLTVLALRVVIAGLLAGSLYVQLVMVPLLADDMRDLSPEFAYLRLPFLAIIWLGIVTIQISLVCVWRLVTMVRRGTVFSHAAFRYVDVVIGAMAVASLLTFALAALLAPTDVAPGIVLLVSGASLLVAGVALIVLVLRMLLAQAVARDDEAQHLQAELDEVI
jgi:Protein of unknown function (DUF2975)